MPLTKHGFVCETKRKKISVVIFGLRKNWDVTLSLRGFVFSFYSVGLSVVDA
jgi:hypothetical protein